VEVQDILKYLKIVRKWWWVIALLFGVTVGTMLTIAFLSQTQYEATVTVQVSAPPPQEVPLYSQYGREALRDEIEQTRTSFQEFLLEGDAPYRAVEALPDIPMQGSELREKITIDIPENSQLVRVGVRASDPETAALLANTLVETGLKRYGELLAQSTANTRVFIEQELEATREELETAEAELIQFQVENKIGDLTRAITSQYELIRSLRLQGDLALSRGDVIQAQAIEETVLLREAELQNMIALSAEYTGLADHVERVRSTHSFLLDKKTEAQIKENQILELGSIQIITPARPPSRPVSLISSKLIVLGAVASLLAGVLLTFLFEYLDVSGVFAGFQRRSERSEVMAVLDNAVR
jgi:uncharacterized protein involved in exopolysaccharide biosynthesis